jgi:cysteine-rich repeat protein
MVSSRLVSLVLTLGAALLFIGPPGTSAYESYHHPNLDGEGYCSDCHPGFKGGFAGALHQLHFMTFTCSLCHTGVGFDNPFIMWSQGNNLGCLGCHGRDYGEPIGEDYRGFPMEGLPKNSGYGLRRHHIRSGITICEGCHGNPPQSFIQPENVNPPYYARGDVSLFGMPVDACTNEDSPADPGTIGLDNDGNLLYESDDPACPPVGCGDGTLDLGEDCDDGNNVDGDGCRGDCTLEICGDGTLDLGEECDDGNVVGGDGCSSGCILEGPPGLDLDISKFKMSRKLKIKDKPKSLKIKLAVQNGGAIAGSANARVVGVQKGVLVYDETLLVTAPVGGKRVRYDFPSFAPADSGEIMWTVSIADDHPDVDHAVATTLILMP